MRRSAPFACAILFACSGEPAAPAAAPSAPEPPAVEAPAAQPAAANPAPAADPNEACAQLILISYAGAAKAPANVERDKAAAALRARELLMKAQTADFAALAKAESDAPSSAQRGGVIGTYRKDEWPALHAALRDPIFALEVGKVAPEPIDADYGFAIVRRCPVEKASSRHILVRYAGAKNAGADIRRSKAEAEARARELLSKLAAGEDFAALAREASEDSSAERGGDMGARGRGVLALPYETALFALEPGERTVVETEFGFHVIERLPDAT